jgi:hypothetical protein
MQRWSWNSSSTLRAYTLGARIISNTVQRQHLLPSIQFAHNCLEMPKLNTSLFRVVFNMTPHLPMDVDITNSTMKTTTPDFSEQYLPRFLLLRDIIPKNLIDSCQRQIYYFDRKSWPLHIKENDLVYKFRDGNPTGIRTAVSPKLLARYEGPYRVVQIVANAIAYDYNA